MTSAPAPAPPRPITLVAGGDVTLGAHATGRGKVVVRIWRPDTTAVTVLVAGEEPAVEMDGGDSA